MISVCVREEGILINGKIDQFPDVQMPHAKPFYHNYRIWGCLVFQSGLVQMYHLCGGKIHTWDPAATHTLTNIQVAAGC